MTDVQLVCSKDGVFKSLKASGHAGYFTKGKDIVCSAITILLRTAMEILEQTEGLTIKTETSSRGNLAFQVEDIQISDELLKARLICTADFLRQGIKSLCQEFPKNVQLREIIN